MESLSQKFKKSKDEKKICTNQEKHLICCHFKMHSENLLTKPDYFFKGPHLKLGETKVKYNRHLAKIISVVKLEQQWVMIAMRRPFGVHKGSLVI